MELSDIEPGKPVRFINKEKYMKIQNFECIDRAGNKIKFNFADMKAQYDAGKTLPFQVINDSDAVAVYRQTEMLGVNDDYTATWWMVDLGRKTISMGKDTSIKGRVEKYTDGIINCTGVLDVYQIIEV